MLKNRIIFLIILLNLIHNLKSAENLSIPSTWQAEKTRLIDVLKLTQEDINQYSKRFENEINHKVKNFPPELSSYPDIKEVWLFSKIKNIHPTVIFCKKFFHKDFFRLEKNEQNQMYKKFYEMVQKKVEPAFNYFFSSEHTSNIKPQIILISIGSFVDSFPLSLGDTENKFIDQAMWQQLPTYFRQAATKFGNVSFKVFLVDSAFYVDNDKPLAIRNDCEWKSYPTVFDNVQTYTKDNMELTVLPMNLQQENFKTFARYCQNIIDNNGAIIIADFAGSAMQSSGELHGLIGLKAFILSKFGKEIKKGKLLYYDGYDSAGEPYNIDIVQDFYLKQTQ